MLQINGSIVKYQNKIWFACRTRHLFGFDSESFLVELNEDFEPVADRRLIAENNNTAFEDIRLFSFGGKLWAFYSFFPMEESGKWQWKYCVGYGEVDPESGLIFNQRSLQVLALLEHEKNWAPYIFNGELFMITNYDPFLRIVQLMDSKCHISEKQLYKANNHTKRWLYGELRGGTPLLKHPDPTSPWHYGFVHSHLSDHQGFKRYYYYTAVRFDHIKKEFQYCADPMLCPEQEDNEAYDLLWQKSNQKQLSVIFPIGIMEHEDGVVVSFGRNDVSTFIQQFSWTYLADLFD